MKAICRNCQHWHQRDLDPMNLAAPRGGECREQLHVLLMPLTGGLGLQTLYPPVPADWPACGRFVERDAKNLFTDRHCNGKEGH